MAAAAVGIAAAAVGVAAASTAAGDTALAPVMVRSVTSAFKAAAAADARPSAFEVPTASEEVLNAGPAAGPQEGDALVFNAGAVMCICVSTVWVGMVEDLDIGAGAVAAQAEFGEAAAGEADGSFCDASSAEHTLLI